MPTTPQTAAPFETDRLEQIVDAYLADYEMVGEAEDGRDACYQPTDSERALIKDAILGLLADEEWDAAWGRYVAALASQPAAPADVRDTARLAFIYGDTATDSDALINLEVRCLNRDYPTLEEVRAAIDAALAASPLPPQKSEGDLTSAASETVQAARQGAQP